LLELVVAILMSVRNEESFIKFNIDYHLDLGFNFIFIANHCSTDGTTKILESYKNNPRIIVRNVLDPVFDHAKIINNLLRIAKNEYEIDWFTFLDADEFLSLSNETIQVFVRRLNDVGIPYATIGWANALFDHTNTDYACSPVNKIDTLKYYIPWPEKSWQEYGHFRKAIVKNHENMEVVVGGHYVKSENNIDFFGEFNWNPHFVPFKEAKLLHFEFRDKAEVLYEKWRKLAEFEDDSTSSDLPLDEPYSWMQSKNTCQVNLPIMKQSKKLVNGITHCIKHS
jgi:glycosyltransferase involved in cell wall biosynthesis